jgi:hypothetical protein
MKSKHPQIHLHFIPANCTSIFQLADVILQRPFKHAFQLEFIKYIMDVFTKQLEDGVDLKMDMKMSTLKPKICGWLHKAWEHLTCKEDMVKKGWGHTGLLQAFQEDFQKQAMMENIKDPLFTNIDETNASEKIDHTNMEEICAEVSIDTVLDDSLLRVSLLMNGNTKSSITSLHKMARKGPTLASNNTFQSNSTTISMCSRSNMAVQLLPNIPISKVQFSFSNPCKMQITHSMHRKIKF